MVEKPKGNKYNSPITLKNFIYKPLIMKKLLLVFIYSVSFAGLFAQNIHRVDSQASGSNDGTSWSDAFSDLQTALDNASEGDQIWIRTGIYVPENTDTITSVYSINKALELYGGFSGNENALEDRPNDGSSPTILSGDILGDDDANNNTANRTDNSRHVVYVDSFITAPTIFDGLIISNGNTSNSSDLDNVLTHGGGIITYSAISVNNVVFRNNFARSGAGIALMEIGTQGSTFTNCTFEQNTVTSQAGGLLIRNSADITVTDCQFLNNETSRGALYPLRSSNIDISNCLFEGNLNAGGFGGAFFSWNNQNLSLDNCTFNANSSINAGCAYIDGRELPPNTTNNLNITNCTFNGNSTIDGFGGAVYFFRMGYTMDNCTFELNVANGGSGGAIYNGGEQKTFSISNTDFTGNSGAFGGAIASYTAGTIGSVDNCKFSQNAANTSGGAIITGFTANVAYSNCQFEANTASFGAASFNQNDSTVVSFDNSSFIANNATTSGGAISISGGIEVSINQSEFTGNSSGEVGGAINFFEAGGEASLDMSSLSITNTGFLGNLSGNQGGALNLSNVDTDITSSYFLQNQADADGFGGAISVNAFDTTEIEIRVINSTIAYNIGALAAGISQWTNDSGITTLYTQNNLFDNPGFSSYAIEDGTPDVVSTGGNYISDATLNPYLVAEDIEDINGNPMFTDVFSFDITLELESPCVDAGLTDGAPLTDILGNARVDGVDIGAYENQKGTNTKNIGINDQLTLAPNPASDRTVLTLNNDYTGLVNIEVYAMDGKQVFTVDTEKFNNEFNYELNTNELENGIYIIKTNFNGISASRPLIKQ